MHYTFHIIENTLYNEQKPYSISNFSSYFSFPLSETSLVRIWSLNKVRGWQKKKKKNKKRNTLNYNDNLLITPLKLLDILNHIPQDTNPADKMVHLSTFLALPGWTLLRKSEPYCIVLHILSLASALFRHKTKRPSSASVASNCAHPLR